jgi:hypothetical protein
MSFSNGPVLKKPRWVAKKGLRKQKKKDHSYTSFLSGRSSVSIGELEEYAAELFEWAQDPSVIKVMDFAVSKGIPPSKFRTWVEKNNNLKNAFEVARYIIGSRNERKALVGEFNVGLVIGWMTTYDEEYRDGLRFRAGLSNKNDNDKQKVTVVLEAIASSPQVPVKIKEENDHEEE